MKKTTPMTFERKEIKFILTPEQKAALMEQLSPVLRPDDYEGHYQLMSLYYDSPEKDFYREKHSKQAERKKLRIRRYLSAEQNFDPEELVFIEIKEHTSQINYKRRIQLTAQQALDLLQKGQKPDGYEDQQAILDEILALRAQYHLEPSAITSYERTAFKTDKAHDKLRITFDQGICYETQEVALSQSGGQHPMFESGVEIMEVKVKGELPDRLREMLDGLQIYQFRFSKYVKAIDLGLGGALTPPLQLFAKEELQLSNVPSAALLKNQCYA